MFGVAIPLWNARQSNNSFKTWNRSLYTGRDSGDGRLSADKVARVKKFARVVAEMLVLLGLYLLGGQLAAWLHWPIPGGVVGLALLLLVFASGLIRPAVLQLGAGWLMAEMLLFFIPALMSLLDYGALARNQGWRIMLVIAVSTLTVMLVTALTVEYACRWKTRRDV